ncbi:MAG: hypothetical protein IJ226_01350 [Clostridia bacterium]|nr:hypothetical protein [Clostridia bacterium]
MTKNRFAKISLVIVAILALCMVLSACNIFDGVTKVKTVDISVDSGLVDSNGDGVYEAEAGKEFALSVIWHNILINDPTIRWFVKKGDGDKEQRVGATGSTFKFSALTAGTAYEFSASVNSVESAAPIKVVIIENTSGETELSFSVGVSGISDTDSDGYAEAKFGKTFTVSADFGSLDIDSAQVEWYVEEDGEERKLSESGKSFEFTISSRAIQKYEFRAVFSGYDSENPAKVEFVDSVVENVAITSSSHTIVENTVRQNVVDGLTNVALSVGWNEDELPLELVSIAWYVDDVKQSETRAFVFDASGVTTACEKTVKVVVTYKESVAEKELTLSFVEEFLPVASVSLSVDTTGDVGLVSELSTTFMRTATTSEPGTVSVSANVLPLGTDLSTDCTWTVRDMTGERTLSEKARTVSIALAYGKNVITASIDNMLSRSVIVYALSADDYAEREYAIKNTFVWDGTTQDHYINNQDELNFFIGYLVSTHETSADADGDAVKEVYLAPSEWRDGVNTSSEFNRKILVDEHETLDPTCALGIAMNQGLDESGSPIISSHGNRKFWLSTYSVLGEPTEAFDTDYIITQANVYVRYKAIAEASSRTKLPADDFAETLLVKNSNQLAHALTWGYKPTFEANASGAKLQALYNKAREVLLTYISADMTELEKVGIINDWLVNEVDYDYATAAYNGSDGIKYNAYYLEGVFNDRRAVCDGKSKAFSLLCGMEGIRAMRIIGSAGTSANSAEWGGHAWNKVLVDADGDGVREWFVVDTTWNDTALPQTAPHEVPEILTYRYFLVTDEAIESNHLSSMKQPTATTAFDAYASIIVNGVTLDVTTKEQLIELCNYSSENGKVQIRCRIADSVKSKIPIAATFYNLTNDETDVYYYSAK